jgi:hypothetical protein
VSKDVIIPALIKWNISSIRQFASNGAFIDTPADWLQTSIDQQSDAIAVMDQFNGRIPKLPYP